MAQDIYILGSCSHHAVLCDRFFIHLSFVSFIFTYRKLKWFSNLKICGVLPSSRSNIQLLKLFSRLCVSLHDNRQSNFSRSSAPLGRWALRAITGRKEKYQKWHQHRGHVKLSPACWLGSSQGANGCTSFRACCAKFLWKESLPNKSAYSSVIEHCS